MKIKLDLKDKKILWELDKDSRQSFSKIAKKVGLSKEAVYYRIKNLEKRKIITGYTTLISLAKLNFMHIKILIKFQNITSNKKKEVIDYLVKHKSSNWVASCRGNCDLIVGFVVKDLIEFNQIKEKLFNKYSKFILKTKNSITLEAYIYGRKHLLDKLQETKHYIEQSENIKLSKIDLKLLKILSTNTRIKITEIASKLKTTSRKVTYKIKQLKKKKIIQKYTISINHELLNISYFKSLIYLKNTKKILELLIFLKEQKNCVYNVEALAEWDIEPEFEVYSTTEFYKIIEELENKFDDQIKTINTLLIDKEYKFQLLPQNITSFVE